MANPYKIGIELAMASNHAAVLGALSSSLLQVHPHVNQLIGSFDRLKLAITGALGIAAGSALLSGLEQLIEKTKGLSHELVQLQKMGLASASESRATALPDREAGTLCGQRWSRLSEQNFRVDKWSLCRG